MQRTIPIFIVAITTFLFILFYNYPLSFLINRYRNKISSFPSPTSTKPLRNSTGTSVNRAGRKRITGCVVYLAIFDKYEDKYVDQLRNSLKQYEANIARPLKFKYPALIVHHGWITNDKKAQFYAAAPNSTILFTSVNLSDTSYRVRSPDHYAKTGECKSFGNMYRLMNRVFIRLLFLNEIFKQFDYWLRLDLDITVISRVKVDPFQLMADGHYDFGYVRCFAGPGCTKGYYEFVEYYVRTENVTMKDPKFFSWLKAKRAIFYGNFGIGRVEFFTSDAYLKFAEKMDKEGGIMRTRWDDQHTYAVAIALYSSYERVIGFNSSDIQLVHKKSPLVANQCNYKVHDKV